MAHGRRAEQAPVPDTDVVPGRSGANPVDRDGAGAAAHLLRMQATGGNQMVTRLLESSGATRNGAADPAPRHLPTQPAVPVQRSADDDGGTVSTGPVGADVAADAGGGEGQRGALLAQIAGLLGELPSDGIRLTADEIDSVNGNLARLASLTGHPIPPVIAGEATAGVADPGLLPVAVPAIAEALEAVAAAIAALSLAEILLILAVIVAIVVLIILLLRGAIGRPAPAPAPTTDESPDEKPGEQPRPGPGPGPDPPPPVDPIPPVPPRAIFGPVRAANTPEKMSDRIPDAGTVDVSVHLIGWDPAMGPVQIDVDGSPGGGGADFAGQPEVEVTAPAAVLPVRGVTQSPAHSGTPLILTARLGGAPIGSSAGFAVAAIMQDLSTAVADLVNDASVGMIVSMSWQSDGAGIPSLREIEFEEQLAIVSESGSLAGHGLGDHGGLLAADIMPQEDNHLSLRQDVLAGPGSQVIQQVWAFLDNRTGSVGMAVRNSGFSVTRLIEPDPTRPGKLRMILTKGGRAGAVGAYTTGAGAGHAEVVIPLD